MGFGSVLISGHAAVAMEEISDPPVRPDNPLAAPPGRSDNPLAASTTIKKDRHIVTWTPEEDDLLREQVNINGTDNWVSIAAKFKAKTSRQCRRRWYTYLNSEGKKGGWTAEEDEILCEAQKIFGNRWTEIAKVVSGRTDNAVKNRFSTICKKRAKRDASSKENNGSDVNPNNKRALTQNCSTSVGGTDLAAPVKHIGYQISDYTKTHNPDERSPRRSVMQENNLRTPLSVLPQNCNNMSGVSTQFHVGDNFKSALHSASNITMKGSFLSRNDPKLTALLQQAELLSSLALKVNSENTNQSLENAWKELQDYLIQTGEHGMLTRSPEMDILSDDFKDLLEGLKSSTTGGQLSQSSSSRQHEGDDSSQGSSEYSTGSIRERQLHVNDQTEDSLQCKTVLSCLQEGESGSTITITQEKALSLPEEPIEMNANISTIQSTEFDSPLHTVPTFKSLAEGIPSPTFSTSERQFLRSVLGMSSPAPNPSSCKLPSCKRVLLDSL